MKPAAFTGIFIHVLVTHWETHTWNRGKAMLSKPDSWEEGSSLSLLIPNQWKSNYWLPVVWV